MQIKADSGQVHNHWCVWADWYGKRRVVFSDPEIEYNDYRSNFHLAPCVKIPETDGN